MRRRLVSMLCVLSLLVTLFVPIRATENVCFTAVNDRILPLTASTMPVWSYGLLYVPYSVFDSGSTGVALGTSSTYNKSTGMVSVFSLQQMIVFDVAAGTCTDQHTGTTLPVRAIIRNGTAYLPVSHICSVFGLNYVYLNTDYGYLIRITNYNKNDEHTLSDSRFIDAGSNIMKNRLREYQQSLVPAEVPKPKPETPVTPAPEPTDVPTCIAIRCETGEGTVSMAETLEKNSKYGLFFFPAQDIAKHAGLIRRLLGTGHSVGILAQCESPDQTQQLLELGNRTLAAVAHTRTYYALVPDEQTETLKQAGWAVWSSQISAIPTQGQSARDYTQQTLRALPDEGRVNLTLCDDTVSAELFPALLRQLTAQNYPVIIPRETHL